MKYATEQCVISTWDYGTTCANWVELEVGKVHGNYAQTVHDRQCIASSSGHSQILSHSRGEKLGEGLGSKLRHGPEMVDSV